MKILEIKVMKGPNYWSTKRHKLIVMLLDLEELEEKPKPQKKSRKDEVQMHGATVVPEAAYLQHRKLLDKKW